MRRVARRARRLGAQLVVPVALLASLGLSTVSSAATPAAQAPGASGDTATWTTGGKDGLGTSAETHTAVGQGVSKVWYTLSRGQLNEVFYPQVDVANVEDLQLLVSDGTSFVDNERDNTTTSVSLPDPRALEYVQSDTAKNGKYTITKRYVTDPARATLLIQTTFHANVAGLQLYAHYNPSLNNSAGGDTGDYDTASGALVAHDGTVASALRSSIGFTQHSTGYVGDPHSDGYQDVYANKTLADTYDTAATPGNIVQTGRVPVGGAGSVTTFTLALAFGPDEHAAAVAASASLATGFGSVQGAYVNGWHAYLSGLFARVPVPASVSGSALLRNTYTVSLMVLKAHEDKDHPGANVASLTNPWGDITGAMDPNVAGYHHIWARDLYEVASTQLAAGDRDAAQRSADYLFETQQVKTTATSEGQTLLPGAFPRFSRLDGVSDRGCCEQLDEDAFPIILQWQLNHATPDPSRWAQVKLTADHLRSVGPSTPAERWEEMGGESPSTLAAEIAGLVAAADLARVNGDSASASAYLSTADSWRASMDSWTYTTTGQMGDGRYYERIDGDYDPDDENTRCFNDGCFPEKDVVDGGFLELSRLGVRPATYPDIVSSLPELDSATGVTLDGEQYWHRYNHDGYGEDAAGKGWNGDGRTGTRGRPWPLLSGERGEYSLEVDHSSAHAAQYLTSMAAAAGRDSYLIGEQIWDDSNLTTADGVQLVNGQHTGSATPLAWATAQYVRLALSMDAGAPVETPAVVQARYGASVTLTVHVPAGTDASGLTPFVAGNLSGLNGGLPDWQPGIPATGTDLADGVPLTRVDATTWRVVLPSRPSTQVQYKLVLNRLARGSAVPGWSHVEKNAQCAEIPNRTFATAASGSTGVAVTVAAWAGLGQC